MQDTKKIISYLAADDLHLRIDLGACRLEARPGDMEGWVSVTCHHPTGKRVPIIRQEGRVLTITEEKPFLERIPAVIGDVPRYEVEFGKGQPFALTIETGASEFDMDLGGVPLNALTVKQRAGRFNLDFSAPNPGTMSLLDVSSGAAGIELEHLANAKFSQMRLSGGAAGYELDFGGELSRDAEVTIETSLSGVEIAVPATTAAKIEADTSVGSVDVGDGFTKSEGVFLTDAGTEGKKPLLTIRAGVRLGALQLRTAANPTRR
jgi:hypothetical protein